MDVVNAIKERYLLEESHEALYEECTEWLSTISFWQSEAHFFKKLVKEGLFQNVNQEDRTRINNLFADLIGSDLKALKLEVEEHEKGILHLIEGTDGSGDLRLKHRDIGRKLRDIHEHMKLTKYSVFELLKLVSENFFNGNETLHMINERRAVRKYKKEAISKNHIEQIISAGRMAPSAMNRQPWAFYVITDPEKIKRYSNEIQKVGNRMLHFFLRRINHEEDSVFHGAPVIIFITAKKSNEWGSLDVGMCAQNIMLAAKAMGYDTCPVGLAKAIEDTESYEELRIPSSEEIKLCIVLGKGDETPKVHERKDDNIVFLN